LHYLIIIFLLFIHTFFVFVTHLQFSLLTDFQPNSLNNNDCDKCETGKYKATTGSSSSCSTCPEGYWVWGNGGNATCDLQTKCARGKYMTNTPTKFIDRTCEDCEIAKYSSTRDVAATAPTSGNGNARGGGVTSCKLCGTGKYQNTAGQRECKFW
tara:strand:+ start:154 stop:618 length:465 start_codon:yes stop_codon:yes gene_type:complete